MFKTGFVPISDAVHNFLATGNFSPRFCSDLQQTNGFVIMADRLNVLRWTAHFRSVHRGAYFAEMKTTTVRKLLPDSWGFMCPVHTPDGAPCGLLNHMAAPARVVDGSWNGLSKVAALAALLETMGMTAARHTPSRDAGRVTVLIDGAVVGSIAEALVPSLERQLRQLKCEALHKPHACVPPHLECLVIPTGFRFAYAGVYIFTGVARLMRPVMSLAQGCVEWIGTAEQAYMDVAVVPEEARPETQYVELNATQMLSLVASLTPFCDFNQSPRNMYQVRIGQHHHRGLFLLSCLTLRRPPVPDGQADHGCSGAQPAVPLG